MTDPQWPPIPFPGFFNSIAEKLDSSYLLWKQQVELVIKSHKLHRFVVNLAIPSKFLIKMIVFLELLIQHMKDGKFKIKSCYLGFNQLCPRLSCFEFLELFTRTRFGNKYMIISLPKPKLEQGICTLIFEPVP